MKNSSTTEFYQKHLNRVSRSFAFCIAELEEPLREYVGLTYLLCRVIDTVEDSAWPDPAKQKKQFTDLIVFFQSKPSVHAFAEWISLMPRGLPEGEQLLLIDSYRLIEDYYKLSPDVRKIIQGPLITMATGMSSVLEKKSVHELRLKNILELNHYCFFVAGVVGEILTRLVSHHHHQAQVKSEQVLESLHFGLFLQKINILKDHIEDVRRGFFFFDKKTAVISSLREHATKAKDYLLALPVQWNTYRLFCSFSLSLGLISLPFILNQPGFDQKITRDQTKLLMSQLKEMSSNNVDLGKFLQTWIDHLPTEADFADAGESRFQPEALYQGILSTSQIEGFFKPSSQT